MNSDELIEAIQTDVRMGSAALDSAEFAHFASDLFFGEATGHIQAAAN